jgi:outer membrane protein
LRSFNPLTFKNQKMKKVLLTIFAFVAVAAMTQAQTTKGNLLLGGNAGFGSTKQGEGDAATTITFSPNLGYFVAENIAVGGRLGFNSFKVGEYSESDFGFAPFVRYYFVSLGSNAKLMADASFGFGSTKVEDADALSYTNWAIAAGPAVFLNKNTALEVTLSYGSQKYKDVDAANTFGLNVGFQIHFGK